MYEINLLQNSGTETSLSSISLFIALLVFGGAFTFKKNKTDNKPWYTRLNPDWITRGFINVSKFEFTPPTTPIICPYNYYNNIDLQKFFKAQICKEKCNKTEIKSQECWTIVKSLLENKHNWYQGVIKNNGWNLDSYGKKVSFDVNEAIRSKERINLFSAIAKKVSAK